MVPDGDVEAPPDVDGELTDGDVETPPDVDGELTLPVAGELTVLPDGELWLMPVPLVAPVLVPPGCVLPELTDPDALGLEVVGELEVVGDADGLLERPAACIAS